MNMRFLSDSGYPDLLKVSLVVKETNHNNLAELTYIKIGAWFLEQKSKKETKTEKPVLQPCSLPPPLLLLLPQCVYQDEFSCQP